jgi:hypothetical protein
MPTVGSSDSCSSLGQMQNMSAGDQNDFKK